MKLIGYTLAALSLFLLPACSAIKAREEIMKAHATEHTEPKLYEWLNPSELGNPSVRISLNEQKAQILDRGETVAWTYVATGVDGHRTPAGRFSITEKVADKHSNTWGVVVDAEGDVINSDANSGTASIPKGGKFIGAPMPHWMRLTSGGIGMHEGIIPDPGVPASHGCIRLPGEMASLMFEHLPEGTPVVIE